MSIYEFLEDFDNPELEGYDWEEQMRYAVHHYNEEYEGNYKLSIVKAYKQWKREKLQPEI